MSEAFEKETGPVLVPERRVLLGLGGNVGDVVAHMAGVLSLLQCDPNIELVRCSGIYETPPWGVEDQPVFLNACAEISTSLEPEDLLRICQQAETQFDRKRDVRWGPRTIDIDILMLEEGAYYSDILEVPHRRILERAFVLVPLAEIASEWILENNTIGNWRYNCDDSGINKIAEPDVFDMDSTS